MTPAEQEAVDEALAYREWLERELDESDATETAAWSRAFRAAPKSRTYYSDRVLERTANDGL